MTPSQCWLSVRPATRSRASSTTKLRRPLRLRSRAAVIPDRPPPTTATSNAIVVLLSGTDVGPPFALLYGSCMHEGHCASPRLRYATRRARRLLAFARARGDPFGLDGGHGQGGWDVAEQGRR